MSAVLKGTGIDPAALERYVREQICSLPGIDRHEEVFTVLLTGSRASGAHGPRSDVDIDAVCPQAVYDRVSVAAVEAGIIKNPKSFFCILRDDNWERYFGSRMGRPHFALTPLEQVERQVAAYEDVPLWIWTNARVLTDPGRQFRGVIERFRGYPPEVLHPKIKYHWLLAGYWQVDCYPHHHAADTELLAAATAVLNAVNELLRFFYLIDGKPFPYTEKLMHYARGTRLGAQSCPLLERAVALTLGTDGGEGKLWDRLDRANEIVCCADTSPEADALDRACAQAMIDAGLDPGWVRADYDNIDELLSGRLGPLP